MMRVRTMVFQVVVISVSIYLLSCATVTVNVYFPAEEVRQAYETLEEELLKPPQEETPGTEKAPKQGEIEKKPQSILKYPDKPQLQSRRLIILTRKFSLDLGTFAWAQDDLDKAIVNEIRNMPDVVQAYRNRGGRLDVINNMLSQGKVGIGNKGLLVDRGGLTKEEKADFNAENKDRETIIEGMATAIIKINNIDPTPQNIEKVIPEAAEQFAAVRRNEAQPGWWIQLPDGRWMQK
ncbi:MAG TPA: DUF1318 domain-containing protein [Thermodesulfobacteriota bacterium]|nr:DUF1318 domain-containing protein [Thermodesulfobacteriota bacterium]